METPFTKMRCISVAPDAYPEACSQAKAALAPTYEDLSGDGEHMYIYPTLKDHGTPEMEKLCSDLTKEFGHITYVRFEEQSVNRRMDEFIE